MRDHTRVLALTTSVNGAARELRVAAHETLLDVLRERLALGVIAVEQRVVGVAAQDGCDHRHEEGL